MNTVEKVSDFDTLIPYLEEFVPLVIKLVNDSNFKITINGLNIVGIILKGCERSVLKPYLNDLVNNLL